MTTLTIPKQMTRGNELVVISLKEYEQLRREFRELKDAFAKIQTGEMELRRGKTHVVKSLAEI